MHQSENRREADYKADVWSVFQSASNDARNILDNAAAAQEQINEAYQALHDALNNLLLSGDLNGDGYVNFRDITLMQQYITGGIEFTDQQKICADLNEDGFINFRDITAVQKRIVGGE